MKPIVERAGFSFENGKQVTESTPISQDAPTTTGTATKGGSIPQTPEKPRKKVEPGSSPKRCKSNKANAVMTEAEGDDEDAAGVEESTLAEQGVENANGETA